MGDESVKPDAIEDRPLTEKEKDRLARGLEPVGSGTWKSFAELPPETLAEYRRRSIESKRRKKQAAQLVELEAYMDAHKEHASEILGAKLMVISGLLDEMRCIEEKSGAETFDTRLIDEKRLKLLLSALNDFEKRAYDGTKKSEQTVNVNIAHVVADIKRTLGA
jgi:hypothetical protein